MNKKEKFIIFSILLCGIGVIILSFPCFQNLSIIKDFLAFLAGGGLTSYLICKFVVPEAVIGKLNQDIVKKFKYSIPSLTKKYNVIKAAFERENVIEQYKKDCSYGFFICGLYTCLRTLRNGQDIYQFEDFIHYLGNDSRDLRKDELIKEDLQKYQLATNGDELSKLKELAFAQ